MNSRAFLRLSVLLNLSLAGLLLFAIKHQPAHGIPMPVPPLNRIHALTPSADVPATAPTNAFATVSFHWSQVASDDLKTYRDNLRAIGCPELTVRDILLAEIWFRGGERRHALLAGLQSQFWELAARDGLKELAKQWKERLHDIDKETSQTLADVLGSELPKPPPDPQEEHDQVKQGWIRRYAWLPEEKQKQLLALEERYWNLNRDLSSRATAGSEATELETEKLNKLLNAERAQLLTPDESAEFELRNSRVVGWANQVPGFHPTETEWRQVARLHAEYDKALARVTPGGGAKVDGEAQAAHIAALNQALEQSIRETLGPDRYADYERGQQGNFVETRRVTQRYGLPDETAAQVYKVQQSAEAEAQKLRQDPALDPAVRDALLGMLQEETASTLSGTLGPRVFGTYQKYAGDWLEKMSGQ